MLRRLRTFELRAREVSAWAEFFNLHRQQIVEFLSGSPELVIESREPESREDWHMIDHCRTGPTVRIDHFFRQHELELTIRSTCTHWSPDSFANANIRLVLSEPGFSFHLYAGSRNFSGASRPEERRFGRFYLQVEEGVEDSVITEKFSGVLGNGGFIAFLERICGTPGS